MSSRRLSDWLGAYLDYSASSEAPDIFHVWTGISCLAGAIRRKVWMDQGYFQWTPNFYVVFVAPPGIISKSTTANIGISLLREVPEIAFGPDVVTWQALVTSLANSAQQFPIGEMFHTMSAVTIASSEFGNLLNPNDREMVDLLVSLWDGQIGTFEKRTKTSGDDTIVNPWVNIIACTTPAWIAGNFPEYMIMGGFTSRTIFVYGDQKRHLVAYPSKVLPTNFLELRKDLIHDLEYISTQIAGEFRMTDEAVEWGERWYRNHYKNPPTGVNADRIGGYFARKQTHMHKLAMILSVSQRDDLLLTVRDLEIADTMLTATETSMHQVFSHIIAPETRYMKVVLSVIRTHAPIAKGVLYKMLCETVPFDEFNLALNAIVLGGFAKLSQNGSDVLIQLIKEEPDAKVDGTASAE